jgi:hypothetical protein
MHQDRNKNLVLKGDGDKRANVDAVSTVPSNTDDLSHEEKVYRDAIIPLLLIRAYHLPKNNYLQDLRQYMCNNHPVFGIWLHHRYHPIQRMVRIISLIGSMLFGLAITNIIYLAFVFAHTNYDKSYVEVHVDAETGKAIVDNTVPALSVTNGNIALWTIGAALHASFDNLIWSLAACSCCSDRNNKLTEQSLSRYRSTGVILVVLFVIVATALATFAVALRAAISSPDTNTGPVDTDTVKTYGLTDDNVQLFQVDGANDFEFIIAYLVELALNYFMYYPLVGTILFSGVLTCGRYGVLGGRPYEMKMDVDLDVVDEIHMNATTFHASSKHDLEQPKIKSVIK